MNKGLQGYHKTTPGEDVILCNFSENHVFPVGRLQSIHTRMSCKRIAAHFSEHLYVMNLNIQRLSALNSQIQKYHLEETNGCRNYEACDIMTPYVMHISDAD